jgi:hydroxymethylbilane synthase
MGLRLGTRGSALARAQAEQVAGLLGDARLVEAVTDGERGDKSRFTRGVERLLLDGEADLGVHSAKDLPTAIPETLAIVGVPQREDAADAWIGPGSSLDDVPEGASVGTSSLRRRALLLALRPDLDVRDMHGNVDTRLRRREQGDVDAIVLAAAGLRRLGREGEISFLLAAEQMTPAGGQGALALEAVRSDESARAAAASISDETALVELTAERATVAALDASCMTPLGVHARRDGEKLRLDAFVGLPDGSEWIRDRIDADAEDPAAAGAEIADRLLAAGAAELLQRAEAMAEQRAKSNEQGSS